MKRFLQRGHALLLLAAMGLALPSTAMAQLGRIHLPSLPTPQLPKISVPKLPKPSLPTLPQLPKPGLPKIELPKIPDLKLPQPKELFKTDTNRAQVKASLKKGGYLVLFSKELTHAEELKFASALASSVASANPGPALTYVKSFLLESKKELLRNIKHLKADAQKKLIRDLEMLVVRALDKAVQGKGMLQVQFHGVDLDVGLATYNHWKKVSGHYPRISAGRIVWDFAEKRVPLPNTFQPYLRLRVRISVS